jgi:hypothetical protein
MLECASFLRRAEPPTFSERNIMGVKMQRLWLMACMVALTGCATQKMSGDQLARVAKDWSLSVRASQIIPVYPMTEDLQPGDVFLVQTPIEDQVKVYLDKGFLSLENLVTRLPTAGYKDFYRGYPQISDDETAPPRLWQFSGVKQEANFAHAPLAAFPSYGFSVSRSEGLNLAIPVQGVPIGLNLLDSASATGTITLKEAYTYALPGQVMFELLDNWRVKQQAYLQQFAPWEDTKEKKTHYSFLRVVNRVYLVKTVNITLFSGQGTSGALSAGVPKPVELMNIPDGQKAVDTFKALNDIIGKATESVAPAAGAAASSVAVGGSVKVAMATNRSVSLVETFPRPLAIGYLAFDYRILPDGKLDAPIATLASLESRSPFAAKPIVYDGCDGACQKIRDWRNQEPDKRTQAIRDWLKKQNINKRPYEVIDDPAAADIRHRIVEDLIGQ